MEICCLCRELVCAANILVPEHMNMYVYTVHTCMYGLYVYMFTRIYMHVHIYIIHIQT